MKALVKERAGRGLTLKKVPVVQLGGDDHVLIKIKKTAICGTDVHIYQWNDWASNTIPTPLVIGHEFCGHVVQVGAQVQHFKVGDRVSGEGHLVCGVCRNCRGGIQHLCPHTIGVGVHRQGAFAEFLSIPAHNVMSIPEAISDDLVAILDPLGNAVHTALSYDCSGEDVLVTGAGPTGLMAAKVCLHLGARHVVITDVNEYRLNLAKKMGIKQTVNVSQAVDYQAIMANLGMKEGFDIGLEMSGHPNALNTMHQLLRHGSRSALLGIFSKPCQFDFNAMIFKGITIKGIYGRQMYETWYKMISMLQSGLELSAIITHQLDLVDYEQGFDLLLAGKAGKIILNW
jgi:threonine 3-dehydrogenase